MDWPSAVIIAIVLLLIGGGAYSLWQKLTNPMGNDNTAAVNNVAEFANAEQPIERIHQQLISLRVVDPGFDPDNFLERSGQLLSMLQQCWQTSSCASIAGLVAPNMCSSWEMQYAEKVPINEGMVNFSSFVSGRIVSISIEPRLESISIRYDFSDTTQDKSPLYLTFDRDRAASSSQLPTKCSNCGAALEGSRRCSYCGALVSSLPESIDEKGWEAGPDWTLVSVTSAASWASSEEVPPGPIPGFPF